MLGLPGLRGITTIKKYSSGNRESRQKLAAILRVQNAMKRHCRNFPNHTHFFKEWFVYQSVFSLRIFYDKAENEAFSPDVQATTYGP